MWGVGLSMAHSKEELLSRDHFVFVSWNLPICASEHPATDLSLSALAEMYVSLPCRHHQAYPLLAIGQYAHRAAHCLNPSSTFCLACMNDYNKGLTDVMHGLPVGS